MLLPDRLDQRIAEAIKNQIANERNTADISSDAWRSRCEIAMLAMMSDAERSVFIHHISERRGSVGAKEIESQARALRTIVIYFLVRKPS